MYLEKVEQLKFGMEGVFLWQTYYYQFRLVLKYICHIICQNLDTI
jgi:hypothetical protein